MANQHVNKVAVNGKTVLDLSGDTVYPAMLAKGITAHDKSGAKITGTLTVPGQETRNVELNMQSGNQAIVASTGMLMKQVTVVKPGTFLPENIKKGVNIGGVIGTLEASPSGGGSTRETWVLNNEAYPPDSVGGTFNANFTSNGLSFSSIAVSINLRRQISYGSIVVKAFDAWTSQAYRKLTFDAPPTGDLLTWLQANGVKQANDTAVQPSKDVSITANGTTTITPDAPYDALKKVDVTVDVASGGGGEDDLITFDIEVDFSNCPDADVTVWESFDKYHDLTSNNRAAELKVQRGAVIAVTSSNLIAGATTEENAAFDIAGLEGEYEHTYDSAEYAPLSMWTYLVAVDTGGNDNFAYLVLSMRKG